MKTLYYASFILPAIYVGTILWFFVRIACGSDGAEVLKPHHEFIAIVVAALTGLFVLICLTILWLSKYSIRLRLQWSIILILINMIGVPLFFRYMVRGSLPDLRTPTKLRPKIDKFSYFLGISMGVMIGIVGGYLISIVQGLHQMGFEDSKEVSLSLAVLRKFEKNDTEAVPKLLRLIIADRYLEHTNMTNSWWMRTAYQSPKLINQVEKTADEQPSLKDTIKERRAQRTQEADHDTSGLPQ